MPNHSTECPLCSTEGQSILWQDALCRVIWVEDPDYPGFCRVILNTHIKEMTDLPETDRARLMGVVFAVEAAVREVLNPDKINLASLGNVVPHLHWHVIPRFADDRHFPDAVWAPPRQSAGCRGPAAPEIKPRLARTLAALLAPPE